MNVFRRGLVALAASVAIVSCLATTAVASTTAKDQAPAYNHDVNGVVAEYNGKTIDLSRDWEGADFCVQETTSMFRCVDRPVGEFGPAAIEDCAEGALCLWDNRNYAAAGIELRHPGRYDLGDFAFGRDRANSVFNYRKSSSKLIDLRTPPISDREYTIKAGGKLSDLGQIRYPGGGSWNNKIDVVELF